MTIIYILVGIIAVCGLIGTVVFVYSWFKHGIRIAKHEVWLEEMSDKDIEFINNHEYCPDAYLDLIAEADHAYDSYVGDNHPADDKQ